MVNEATYNELVSSVMKKYQGLKNIDQGEVAELVKDLKKHWKNIKGNIEKANRLTSKAGKKVSKVVKKTLQK